MSKVETLVYAGRLHNEEASIFFKRIIDVVENFDETEGDDNADRPAIESMNAETTKTDLKLDDYIYSLKESYSPFQSALSVPVKLLETAELELLNNNRIFVFGTIKKTIQMYKNTVGDEASKVLWNHIRKIKNLRRMNMHKVSGYIKDLIEELHTEEMAALCKDKKIESTLSELEEMQNSFEEVYSKRANKVEQRVIKATPYKNECIAAYRKMIDYINSMVLYNSTTNYQTLVDNLNAIVNPMNKVLRLRIEKKTDTNPDTDRPIIE